MSPRRHHGTVLRALRLAIAAVALAAVSSPAATGAALGADPRSAADAPAVTPAPSATPAASVASSGPDADGSGPATSTSHAFLGDGRPVRGVATAPSITLPPGFTTSVVLSGLNRPTKVQFAADGSIWVSEKAGQILRYSNASATPTVFADLSSEIDDYWDRGLTNLVLSPTFPADTSIYVLYPWDHNPVHDFNASAPAQWNDNCPSPPGATTDGCPVIGRLTRLTANASGTAWTGKETVLLQGWCQQYPSHSQDDVVFGPDGELYVSSGDGASFTYGDYGQGGGTTSPAVTPANPCGDPPNAAGSADAPPAAEGGALRAQSVRRTDGPALLNGAVLRLDPSTGAGGPGNPFASSSDANAKRILAYGLRNPYRFAFRPGHPGELWLGDVGYSTWEEIDRIAVPTASGAVSASAVDYGWPCFEGNDVGTYYGGTATNLCSSLVASGAARAPFYRYNHAAHINPNETCRTGSSAISGLAFYTGTTYPPAYRNALFFADYSRDCIWAMLPDSSGNPNPANVAPVVQGSASGTSVGPVDLEMGPDGNLYYVDFDQGTVNRLSYGQPVAIAKADVTSGASPLTVHFDGTQSANPAGGSLGYAWSSSGGTCSGMTSATPSCVYTVGRYNVTLTVTDVNGASSTSAPISITAGDTPPVPVIDTIDGAAPPAQPTGTPPPVRPAAVPPFWSVGDAVAFGGHASDAQDGVEPASRLSWSIVMHHCPSDCHTHDIQTSAGVASGSFAAPDHSYPSFLEVRLTATDAQGLTGSSSVYLYPRTATIHLATSPSGLQLTAGTYVNLVTPATATFIDGGSTQLAAAPLQALVGHGYSFASWSDGGAATHAVTARDGLTYTASYGAAATYHALPPARILDTRVAVGAPTFRSGVSQTFAVAGHGGVPAGAIAITGNLTVAGPTHAGFVTLMPVAIVPPPTSTLNFVGGDTRANGATVPLGPGGSLAAVYVSGRSGDTVSVILDVTGYFTGDLSGTTYHPLLPARILDTRARLGGDAFRSGVPQTFGVAGRARVPSGAVAVTGNLTIAGATTRGFVALTTAPASSPGTSTINFLPGEARANGVTVRLGANGTIAGTYVSGRSGDTVSVIFDVTGYFTADLSGAAYHPLTPARVLDSRIGLGAGTFRSGVGQTFGIAGRGGVPARAVAVAGNLTVTAATYRGYVALTPLVASSPGTSTTNFAAGQTIANNVVALESDGSLAATYVTGRSGDTTSIVFDVTGWFG